MIHSHSVIPLTDDERKTYSKYDYAYFLERHLKESSYSDEDVQKIHLAYRGQQQRLRAEFEKNKRQALYFLDGQIRKCHSGGYLPSLFNLDESREVQFLDFEEVGNIWACFEVWRKTERRKIRRMEFWNVTIKIGALLGFVSTAIQISSVLN